jgi:GNAT superfamily N-acetyltransferase
MSDEPTIRRLEPRDEARVREIAGAAKGHWGYDPERVAGWAASMDLGDRDETWVASVDDVVVAWAAVLPGPSVCILDDLWVEPSFIGRGIGSALFRHAVDRARRLGANWLQWDSEPNAVGFYEKLGAVQVGETLGSWGRMLPVMQYELRR